MRLRVHHIALLVAVALTATGCHKKDNDKRAERGPVAVTAVRVGSQAQTGQGDDCVSVSGTIEAGRTAPVSFTVAGTIKEMNVEVGSKVVAGQLLAALDDGSMRSAYEIAAAAASEANDLEKRMRLLHDKRALAEVKWIEVQSKAKQARAAAALAKRQLDDTRLTAPYAGTVSQKIAETGQTVAPSQPVYELQTDGRRRVTFDVSARTLKRLEVGMPVTVILGEGAETTDVPAKISEKGVSADPVTRTYTVKADLGIDGQSSMPGAVCSVKLPVAQIKSHSPDTEPLTIPASAVVLGDMNRTFVWLIEKGRAVRRNVTLGSLTGDNDIIVRSGLDAGDTVITGGTQKVSSGMAVKIASTIK